MIDWENQYHLVDLFVTGHKASGGNLALARAGLKLMLSQRQERIEKLTRFVAYHGITLDGSHKEMVKLCEFFTKNIDFEPGKNRMRSEWLEFCLDTGVFIGEKVRSRVPTVEWVVIEEEWSGHPHYHDIGISDGDDVYLPVFSHIIKFGNSVLYGHLRDKKMRSTFFSYLLHESYRRGLE